jgi:hypothetical protein
MRRSSARHGGASVDNVELHLSRRLDFEEGLQPDFEIGHGWRRRAHRRRRAGRLPERGWALACGSSASVIGDGATICDDARLGGTNAVIGESARVTDCIVFQHRLSGRAGAVLRDTIVANEPLDMRHSKA